MKLTIPIAPWRVAHSLALAAACLTLASYAGQLYQSWLDPRDALSPALIALVNVRNETAIPTWYSSSMLLLCSVLLAAIARARKTAAGPYVVHWKALAIIFLYLSVDEATSIHERTDPLIRRVISPAGLLYFPWIVLGATLTAVFLLAYLRFLAHLPARTRLLFLGAGTLYVGGALGLESLGGYFASLYGIRSGTVAMVMHAEELLEMLGLATFVYALLAYLRSHVEEVAIRFDEQEPVGPR